MGLPDPWAGSLKKSGSKARRSQVRRDGSRQPPPPYAAGSRRRRGRGHAGAGALDASRRRRSPPADLFLGLFSAPSLPTNPSAGEELLEGDLLFPAAASNPPPDPSKNADRVPHGHLGLLAALHDGDGKLLGRGGGGGVAAASATAGTLLRRKATIAAASAAVSAAPSLSSALAIPVAPRSSNPDERPAAPYHQSAPVIVPVRPPPRSRGWNDFAGEQGDEDGVLFRGDAAILPPHEMVARSSASGFCAPVKPSSMLEGAGRTLKGRDLRRVRDAVLRQTGFLD